MVRWFLLAGLVACGGELSVDPENIDWGDVDFNTPAPDQGHSARDLTLHNTGSGELEVVILDFDTDRLALGGQFSELDPPRVTLSPGEVSVLSVGVADYTPGEVDTTIRGAFTLASSRLRDDIEIAWSYVPKRDAPD